MVTKTKASIEIIFNIAQGEKPPPQVCFSKYDQIRRRLQIDSHLPNKSAGENVTLHAVRVK